MELPKTTSSDQYGRPASDLSAYISEYCKFNLGILLFFFNYPRSWDGYCQSWDIWSVVLGVPQKVNGITDRDY